jgi:uracil-DNA glycosylase family 4
MPGRKQQKLNQLKRKMSNAVLPLKKTAQSLVFGEGSCDPKALFIGEAPGANEDKQGLPFVGTAGKHLDLLLGSINLTRDEVYITSIIKYRPPGNRQPTVAEIKAHTPFLMDQIRIMQPKLIVTLGNFATRFILSGLDITTMSSIPGITQIHGKPQTVHFDGMDLTVLPMFHPAALLYRRPLQKILEADFQQIPKYF